MKKITILLISIVFLVAIIWSQSKTDCCKLIITEAQSKSCSQIIESMQLCVNKTLSKVNEENKVIVNLTLTNLSDKTIEIPRSSFEKMYDIKIYDSKGNKLLSKLEIVAKRVAEGRGSKEDEELVNSLPIYSRPASVIIEPKQEISIEFNLSQFYDFTEKGKYKIEVSRKLPSQKGSDAEYLSAGVIEIEIK